MRSAEEMRLCPRHTTQRCGDERRDWYGGETQREVVQCIGVMMSDAARAGKTAAKRHSIANGEMRNQRQTI